ncbi:MAG: alpha/beta hydrolase [Bacteroidales bacterium]|nr:alpha/beta hydrolase [Bacteroidales bacterium]
MKNNKSLIIGLLSLMTVSLFSCAHIDISRINTSEYYKGTINDSLYVVKFENLSNASAKEIDGVFYKVDTSIYADPVTFNSKLKGKKIILRTKDGEKEMTCSLNKVSEDVISGKYKSANGNNDFTFSMIAEPEYKSFNLQYIDEIYAVTVDNDVVYGKVKGNWTSLPETEEPFAKVFANKLDDVAYYNLHPNNLDLTMDIYQPVDNGTKLRPLFMIIHGGAFFNEDKQSKPIILMANHFASMGYVVVSINYRMGFLPSKNQIDRIGYKATQDANAAMRYLVANAYRYRIDKNLLFVGGMSAGGITALNMTFMRSQNIPKSATKSGLFKDDLGPINAVSPEYTESYHIKAVANMWGAVHDLSMLDNSVTSIISFHGDADNIVPYDEGYPFQLLVEKVPKLKLNEYVVNKMYGSKVIHQYADKIGLRNKLYTKHNAKHGLHKGEVLGTVSPYFYFIEDSITAFFYPEIVKNPVEFEQDKFDHTMFSAVSTDVDELYWRVVGGVILESDDRSAKVLMFRDKPVHLLTISGKYKDGIEFRETKTY